jgi:hypothetical protein
MSEPTPSNIVLDTTTLEKIINEPQWTLDNQEEFWSTYRAQRLVRKWADNVNYEIPYEKWRVYIGEYAQLPLQERQNHLLVKTANRILAAREEFTEKAVAHDLAFLPEGVDLSVTIQFTAFVPPFAFAMEDIVIDVASRYWNGNPEHILNLLVHELFHVGYSYYRTQQNEKGTIPDDLYSILDNIVNEGICTYVGHCALPLFPVEGERDYVMLENMSEVKRQFGETNAVLSQYGILDPEELQKLSWDKGVMGRAYYVSGAYMAQRIDEQAGRQALIDVYSKGPISIIKLYNSLAEDGLTVQLLDII